MTVPDIRLPLDWRAAILVLALCLVWGLQQVAIKAVAVDAAPVMQLALRFAVASVFFGIWVFAREGRRAFTDGTLPSGLAIGVMFSLEFILAGEALLKTTAAHTVVFLYSAPIFTALGLQFLPEERLGGLQWMGIALAFLGIAVAYCGGNMVVYLGSILAMRRIKPLPDREIVAVAWQPSHAKVFRPDGAE